MHEYLYPCAFDVVKLTMGLALPTIHNGGRTMWQTMNNVCVKVVALRAKWRTLITRAMHMQVFYLSIRASWYRSNIYQNDNTKTKIVKATH